MRRYNSRSFLATASAKRSFPPASRSAGARILRGVGEAPSRSGRRRRGGGKRWRTRNRPAQRRAAGRTATPAGRTSGPRPAPGRTRVDNAQARAPEGTGGRRAKPRKGRRGNARRGRPRGAQRGGSRGAGKEAPGPRQAGRTPHTQNAADAGKARARSAGAPGASPARTRTAPPAGGGASQRDSRRPREAQGGVRAARGQARDA